MGRSFKRLWVEAPEAEREQLVLELVRGEVADVLGHASPDEVTARRAFIELGFDSLMAIELRSRLSDATGLQLPATVVLDHPNAAALSDHLLLRLREAAMNAPAAEGAAQDVPEPTAPGQPAGTLGGLLRAARDRGEVEEFTGLLMAVSKFRPTFGGQPGTAPAVEPIRLAEGSARPKLICVPSVLAISGPHQYVRLAAPFRGDRDVAALPLPGFTAGELVPEDMRALLVAHAEAVERVACETPFVLVGHSAGGVLAYALAGHLESIGVSPAGVVLIDSYEIEAGSVDVLRQVIDGMLEREDAVAAISDVRLTAMGVYLQLLAGWRGGTVAAPTLLLRAEESMAGSSLQPARGSSWEAFDEAIDVQGDHFTMLEAHAAATAGVLCDWLATTCDS